MTITLWRIAATSSQYLASDMSGYGAKRSGGRWNPVGIAAIYTSENIALAVLETLVHLRTDGLPLNRYLVHVEVPRNVWAARIELAPPIGWDATPAGMISVQVGAKWLRSRASALLVVPSVIVPEESNVIICPRHQDATQITATVLRKWQYDPRHF